MEVTVQFFEDGVLTHCNHAGHAPDMIGFNMGEDNEYEVSALVCDKSNCNAYSLDGEEWIE